MKQRTHEPLTTVRPSHTDRQLISVIIPCYNRAHTLARALDSVAQQSHRADEVIVIDDGSTDQTQQLIRSNYPDVRYIHQANRGVSAARNTGIRAAKGQWIALLDSDDAWQPEKLARQVTIIEQYPDSQLIHCDEIWIRRGQRINQLHKHRKSGGHIFEQCLPLCAISPSAALLRKTLFAEIGLFDESLPACEDYDLWLRICSHYPAHYIDAALVIKYGGHDDQLSKQHWGMDRFRIRALDKLLQQDQLSAEQRTATIAMLKNKCTLYIKGAEKRARHDEADRLRCLIAHHETMLT